MIEIGLKATRNAVYQTAYRAVRIHKYRRPAPTEVVADRFAELPPLRRVLRHGPLWAPSFYVGTAGQVSTETIRRTIERTVHLGTSR